MELCKQDFIAALCLMGASKYDSKDASYTSYSDIYYIKINKCHINIRVTTNLVFYKAQIYLREQYPEVLAKIAKDYHECQQHN